ncbi:hypothetical protein GE09DRAFT_1151547, partial [Coniochaeta sp. 2T2.1]
MYDHFDRAHARHMGDAKQIVCNHPKCQGGTLKFKHLNHELDNQQTNPPVTTGSHQKSPPASYLPCSL